MYLLDTNVVSELSKAPGRGDGNVLAWDAATPQETKFLSVVTIMEVEVGVLLLARRDPTRAQELHRWHDHYFFPAFHGRTLQVTEQIARRCALLHVPNRHPERDAFLAATALVHDMTVVTRNTRDFERTGARILNPWLPA